MTNKNMLCGLCGSLIGAAVGALATHLWYRRFLDKEIEIRQSELEEYYSKIQEYKRESSAEDGDQEEVEHNNSHRSDGVMSPEQRKEIKEKLMRNHAATVNYAAMYHHVPTAETEQEIIEESEKNRLNMNLEPEIIEVEQLEDVPASVEKQMLLYYRQNDVLTTEDGEVLEDPERFVGSCIYDAGLDVEENPITELFVRNYGQNTLYEITKLEDWWDPS